MLYGVWNAVQNWAGLQKNVMKRKGKSRPCKPTLEFKLTRMITECFARYDHIPPATYDGIDEDKNDNALEDDDLNNIGLTTVIEESNIPLYKGSQIKLLVALLLLFNFFTVFGLSNICADEILNVITKLLQKGNKLPKSHWEGNKFLRNLGLSYNSIHACRNGCCWFWQELVDALTCLKCWEMRYTSHNSTKASKILRHFPLIPRLLRMCWCARLAQLTKWHTSKTKLYGNMESVPDSKSWKHINVVYSKFTSEERNIRLRMVLHGVNLTQTNHQVTQCGQ